MNISTYIKTCCAARETTVTAISNQIGKKRQSIFRKMKGEHFTVEELKSIADALNCDLSVRFIDRSTGQPLI